MTPSDPKSSKPSGLLARLFGLGDAETGEENEAASSADAVPPAEAPTNDVPVAATATSEAPPPLPATPPPLPVATPPQAQPKPPEAAPGPQVCPSCQATRKGNQPFCDECGLMFPAGNAVPSSSGSKPAMANPTPKLRIKDRYELIEKMCEKAGMSRYRALDHGGGDKPAPVTVIEAPMPEMAEPVVDDSLPDMNLDAPAPAAEEEIIPGFDTPLPEAIVPQADQGWPSLAWEKNLLDKANHPSLPAVLDSFTEDNCEYLVESSVEGQVLWDAWDDPDANAEIRYGWLKQIAEALHALHQAGAIIEGLRADLVVVPAGGQAVLWDLSDLLPLPLPANPPLRGTLYSAPELILDPEHTDARSDLYSFGAMIYSLEYLHHALEEKDFEKQFSPHQITERFPDVHPLFFRLINKTFIKDLNTRFPTDEASKIDATGFTELIGTLEVCRRTFDNLRLDFAAWTTTGMVRTGNEDALSFIHSVDTRQDDLHEYALVVLADGMGGYEAGEIAAAMALNELKKFLLQQPMFSAVAGKDPPAPGSFDVEACKKTLEAALKHANQEVYRASRAPGRGRRGMGCTAEAIYIDSRNIVVGHVGDSRTYHLHQGRLIQLTRDQTLVNRLVELGQLTEEEAENHPRKNELQQAIGGQPDVVPGLYHGKLKRGDWVLVCSDGLTNHVPTADLEKMLTRETTGSSEEAARRLLNLVNLRGATDNATIVVVRAT